MAKLSSSHGGLLSLLRFARRSQAQRWLSRGPALFLAGDDVVERAVPAHTEVSWERAHEMVTGILLRDLWSGGIPAVAETWLLGWVKQRAEIQLNDAVQRGL